jgi:hypothetical protein
MLDFALVIAALQSGRKVQRAHWPAGNYYFLNGMDSQRPYLMLYSLKRNESSPKSLDWAQVVGTNWEIMVEAVAA